MIRKLAILLALCVSMPAMGATCKISEYWALKNDSGISIPVADEPSIARQEVTYTSSTQSVAFNAQTRFVRIVCDAKAHFVFGANPSAAATDPYLPADVPEYFGVTPGHEVAFYDGTT